jgi:hypothetical protein
MRKREVTEHKLSLRVPPELIERAATLRPRVAKDPILSALGQVSTSAVIKLAIARGLEILEREYAEK